MAEKKLERFGRYLILDHFVDGGMAKICRARYLGDTASKICVIKMIQPQYSQDESFKTMFMDEIKVTFGLLHPNIVQTYDYGYHNSKLYVAMEYCDGSNLKEYLDKLKERKFVFPVEISVYIITQVCQALNYAHTLSDKLSGKDLRIIHRDISPHNIILTYDGVIKVIDFGIAKADTNSEATQAGTIKGKLSYLAPEYLEGKTLDARYDQFAVGITLWEMLCSRKLFKAPNDLAVLKKIQECKVPPPSSINPNVPKELDEIVLKALSKDRSKRFEDMDKLNRALMKFLYSSYPDFNSTDLSYFAKELFKEEIKKDREKLMVFGKMDLRPYIDDMKSEGLMGSNSSSGESTDSTPIKKEVDEASAQKAAVFDFGFEEDSKSKFTAAGTRVINKKEIMGAKGTKTAQIKVQKDANGALSLDGNVKKKMTRAQMGREESTAIRRNEKSSKTRTSQSKLDELEKGKSSNNKIVASVAVLAVVAGYSYMNYPNLLKRFSGERIERLPSSQVSDEPQVETSEDLGMVFIKNFDKYKQKAFINGKLVEVNVLGDIKDVPLNREMVLRVEQPGYKHFVYKFNLNEGQSKVSVVIPEMPNISFGHLMTAHKCVNGTIYFDLFGESRAEKIPASQISSIAFPLKISPQGEVVPTDYEIYFTKDGDDLKRKIKFTLNFENDSIDFCSIYYSN